MNKRMKQHLQDSKRKDIKQVLLIGHKKFNQSATYNIETNLINHFIGDEQFQLQNVSQTRQVQTHQYYQKDFYDEVIFKELWSELQKRNLATHSLDTIRNKDIYKLSPFKELTPDQLEIKLTILDYCKKNINSASSKNSKKVFLIKGEAGTGKSVVVASLYNTLQDYSKSNSNLKNTDNYLLVNHSEMIKTYKSIAESLPNLKKNHILKPTSFINKVDKNNLHPDIVIVDEAHLLLSKKDAYNNFNFDNQLEEIIKRAKITICIFDPNQVLKLKSYWDSVGLENFLKKYEPMSFNLTNQLRMQTSVEISTWVDNFIHRKVDPLPQSTESFKLSIVENPDLLKEKIVQLDKNFGLSRILATFDYPHKKDGGKYYVDPDGINMPWNTTDSRITWAERPETINEVGSIYTAQGFDFNYVGLIIGPSIDYDPKTEQLTVNIEKYQDTGAFTGRADMSDDLTNERKEEIILNSLNILMKRAIHGLYIYPVNQNLRNKLLDLQKNKKSSNN
ncbi:GIY-YIG catalytic domain protein [Enterococcus canintestini]|uniref:GIY-YIG catalytic domain protein n=2 Tax=Enterococcus canintestini TaxID=317010 RepID=A0A1L8R8Q3_9ENTE|nr:GIY-YIG catalytic domain protein [Enterococcus canintestini]